LFLFYIIFIPTEIINSLFWELDKILFPDFEKIEINNPVFIAGNPRSGTSSFYRLLAKDENFTAMRTWEILLAPTIIQKKFYKFLKNTFTFLGVSLDKILQKDLSKSIAHRNALSSYGEDQYLFVHIFEGFYLWTNSGILSLLNNSIYFDEKRLPPDIKRIMKYYSECIKRHLYCFGNNKTYISKNPSASSQIKSLSKTFPGARFIYLVRNPLKVIPSYISLVNKCWDIVGRKNNNITGHKFVIEMAEYWYEYPLKALKQVKVKNKYILRFNDMISKTEYFVTEIYNHFGFNIEESFVIQLKNYMLKYKNYESIHKYNLESMGLSENYIIKRNSNLFNRFRFTKNFVKAK
jgi:hypothetical protein